MGVVENGGPQPHKSPAEIRCARILSKLQSIRPEPAPAGGVSPAFLAIAAAGYGALYFGASAGGAGPEAAAAVLPGGPVFGALLIWLAALVAADIAAWFRAPRVVGMLLAGLLLANLPAKPALAFPPAWGAKVRAAGLAAIYLRCGLALEWRVMSRYAGPAARLALVPGLVEMCLDAALATALFKMPPLLAFALGAILQAVGPALLVPLLFKLQQERRGTHRGAPQAAIVAASLDDMIAITWYSIFICLAVRSSGGGDAGSEAWQIARGPVQVILGVAAGATGGLMLALTRLWDGAAKRAFAAILGCMLLMFALVEYDMLSGGALGSLALGATAAACWRNGRPRAEALTLGPAPGFADELDAAVAVLWDWLGEPMIFGTIGASIDFATLPASVAARALAIVCIGLLVRALSTFATMWGRIGGCACSGSGGGATRPKACARCCALSSGGGGGAGCGPSYTWREALFFAVAWTPKATVQAALSGAPLHVIRLLKRGAPDYDAWVMHGMEIQATGVICVLVCATLGTLGTHWAGARLLERAPHADEERERLAEAVPPAHDPALLSEARASFVGTALPTLVLQYLNLSTALAHRCASGGGAGSGGGDGDRDDLRHPSRPHAAHHETGPMRAPAPLHARRQSAASSGGGGARASASGGGVGSSGGGFGFGAAAARQLDLDALLDGMGALEEHIRAAISRAPLTARRALELESRVAPLQEQLEQEQQQAEAARRGR